MDAFEDGLSVISQLNDGKVRFHHGLDIAVNIGTKVYAPADGKVKFVGRQGGWGKVLKIDHGNGYRTVYAHLSRIVVKPGSEIKRGDLVERCRKSLVGAIKTGGTFVLYLGSMTIEHANWKKK